MNVVCLSFFKALCVKIYKICKKITVNIEKASVSQFFSPLQTSIVFIYLCCCYQYIMLVDLCKFLSNLILIEKRLNVKKNVIPIFSLTIIVISFSTTVYTMFFFFFSVCIAFCLSLPYFNNPVNCYPFKILILCMVSCFSSMLLQCILLLQCKLLSHICIICVYELLNIVL